jgi:hypothetical protein
VQIRKYKLALPTEKIKNMKNKKNLWFLRNLALFFMLVAFIPACLIMTGIIEENDVVSSEKRYKVKFTYRVAQEWLSPLSVIEKTMIKTLKPETNEIYKVYDLIELNINSFKLENRVYLILDNVPYKMNLDYSEAEIVTLNQAITENVRQTDSTEVSVIKGYKETQSKFYRISYALEPDIITKLNESGQVAFRYYAGPEMITVKMNPFDLDRLKMLIDSR